MLIGHLGDEVKMHYFEGGNCIGRFPVATNETYTNKQTGEKITTTEWHNVVVRNRLAEICEKFLSKGDRVFVEGKIKTRQYEQEGIKKYATEIHALDMTFLTTNKDLNAPDSSNPSKASKSAAPVEDYLDDTDDLPF